MKFRIVERAVEIDPKTNKVSVGYYPEYQEYDSSWINVGAILEGFSVYEKTEKEARHLIDKFKIRCRVYNHPERIIEVE